MILFRSTIQQSSNFEFVNQRSQSEALSSPRLLPPLERWRSRERECHFRSPLGGLPKTLLGIAVLVILIGVSIADTDKPETTISKLLEVAEKGDPAAQHRLGTLFLAGQMGVEKDEIKAAYWFSQAAKQNFPPAQFKLAHCYEQGIGVDQDEEHALVLYKNAADHGIEQAQLRAGFNFKKNAEFGKAATYFKMAVDGGNPIAKREYGKLLLEGKGVDKDIHKALSFLEEVAKSGDAEAQLVIAECYSGVFPEIQPDIQKMVENLWAAATANLPAAQSKLGYCYEEGIGLPKDTSLSVKWYRKAAAQNYPQALVNLGFCYSVGKGVAMDQEKAFDLYEKAAEHQFPAALYNIAVCYLKGKGVKKNPALGEAKLLESAKMGNTNAQFHLGSLYEQGSSQIKKNPMEAFFWYKKAADKKDPRALQALTRCYQDGIGITPDGE